MNLGHLILAVGGSFGMLCSSLTLYLIRCLKRMNGYIFIITLLSLSQLVYDLSVVMVVLPGGHVMEFIYIALRSMSGLWATLLTNVLSCVIVYTALTLKSFDIKNNLHIILPVVFVPSTICGVLVPVTLYSGEGEDSVAFFVVSSTYGVMRILSIVFNIICYFLLRRKLSMIKKKSPTSMQLAPAIDTPLHALAARFKYYPIIQVLSRIGVSYYENIYGHEYKFDSSSSLKKKLALLWYVVSLPSAGLGFFVVFLVVTPGAYRHFRKHILGLCCPAPKDDDKNAALLRNTHHHMRSRSRVAGHSAECNGYGVMRRAESSDFMASQYSEWSEEELSDEMSACLSRTSEGEYVMDEEREYLSFYDNEKQLSHYMDDDETSVNMLPGILSGAAASSTPSLTNTPDSVASRELSLSITSKR
jgi:hypothetical protein